MDKQEHLSWAKGRAMEYIEKGDTTNTYTSLAADLGKHPDLEGHSAIMLGMRLMLIGKLSSTDEMRKFIQGIN